MKVVQEGPMYTHTVAINVKRASVLDFISQATYIQSEKLKNGPPPPDLARGNKISNATSLSAHGLVYYSTYGPPHSPMIWKLKH